MSHADLVHKISQLIVFFSIKKNRLCGVVFNCPVFSIITDVAHCDTVLTFVIRE